MKVWRVGVIGCGYWGPNLIRNFMDHPRTAVVAAADVDRAALAPLARRYPGLRLTAEPAEVFADPAVDLVAVATPVRTHFELARAALAAGKHVLVEKPMCTDSAEAEALVRLAAEKKLMLAVDHTFLFTGAFRKVAELHAAGQLGELLYVDSVRVNLGLFQPDADVIWDLAAHDLALFGQLLGTGSGAAGACPPAPPEVVSAAVYRRFGRPAVAWVALRYGRAMAHLTLSWLSPVKIRQMVFAGSRRMAVWDDLQNVARLQVFDSGAELAGEADARRARVEYRRGDMVAPKLSGREALAVEVEHLVECLDAGRAPLNDGQLGLEVVRTLEEISAAARKGGGA